MTWPAGHRCLRQGVELYWHLKKQLDPGSTNAKIEGLLQLSIDISPERPWPGRWRRVHLHGGEGWRLRRRSKKLLEQRPPNRMARFFDFDVDNRGLAVTVL